MTAANLNGRDLDRACAMVLGTYRENCDGSMAEFYSGWICDGCHAVDGGWGEVLSPHPKLRAYSTDPATLDEKLRHLREVCDSGVVITIDEDGRTHAHVDDYDYDYDDNGRAMFMSHGATIHEATARLVVAVAEARAKEKQP